MGEGDLCLECDIDLLLVRVDLYLGGGERRGECLLLGVPDSLGEDRRGLSEEMDRPLGGGDPDILLDLRLSLK